MSKRAMNPKREIADVTTLPENINYAKSELCRLYLLKQPYKEKLEEYEEEMKCHKDMIKEYCAQQQNKCPDIPDVARGLKVQCYVTKKAVKGPSVPEIQQITSEVLNDYQDNATKQLQSKLATTCAELGLTEDQTNTLLEVIANNLQLSAIDVVRAIQHRMTPVRNESISLGDPSFNTLDSSLYTYVVKVIDHEPEQDLSTKRPKKI